MTGKVDAAGMATLAGKPADRGVPERTYPPKGPVPFSEYAALREAAGHACESINELLTLLKFYEPPGKVATKAEERLARLRALGAIR